MRTRTLATVALAAAVTATLLTGSALARGEALRAPAGLKPFLLRANEPAAREFPRTPSFSWAPVRGALRYEFQLAKNQSFTESSIFWTTSQNGPAVAIPLALPWMTGKPYAAYARVRAVSSKGVSAWSTSYGFNLRWKDMPKQLPGYPGLSRWSPVEGATGYEVWFTKIGPGWSKRVSTRTNAVDHRESYAFHEGASWTSEVRWRVRAVRRDFDQIHLNGLPAVSYGPWSPEYVSTNPALSGAVRPVAAITNGATSKAGDAREHELTPAFAFSGRDARNLAPSGEAFSLYRVYIATDEDCVNVVYKGAVVGSPAYAPRTSGPLKLPIDEKSYIRAFSEVLDNGDEANTYMAGLGPVTTTEQAPADPEAAAKSPAPAASSGGASGGSSSGSSSSGATAPVTPKAVDLPESGWPSGRFYWTVVPVKVILKGDPFKVEYHEPMPAQDQCQAGNMVEFGKDSSPVVAGLGTPFASGLSPKGRLVAASTPKVTFYGHPLVAWQPVQGAAGYEVQWSRTRDQWKVSGSMETEGTSVVLNIKRPGEWWYRVRARNPYLPGTVKRMAWSTPMQIQVAAPKFKVAR